jgi:acetolactate decarboxylase
VKGDGAAMSKTVISCRTDGCGCSGRSADAAGAIVRWQGAQKNVLNGDIRGIVELESLGKLPNLYGLGPLAELKGEVTILHAEAAISRVDANGKITTEHGFAESACFLVYAQVKEWQEVPLPAEVTNLTLLEQILPELASQSGIDSSEPFPFLLWGAPEQVEFHILNKTDGLLHSPPLHEKAKVHFTLYRTDLEIIGFHSFDHRGIFTPGNSNLHLHLLTEDGSVSGHVEELTLAGLKLYLPKLSP